MTLFGAINVAMFDWPWSGIHFISGLLIGLALAIFFSKNLVRRFWLAGIGLLVLWELVEKSLGYFDQYHHQFIAPLKQAVSGFAFAPETIANTVGDLIIGSVGLWLGLVVVRKIFQK